MTPEESSIFFNLLSGPASNIAYDLQNHARGCNLPIAECRLCRLCELEIKRQWPDLWLLKWPGATTTDETDDFTDLEFQVIFGLCRSGSFKEIAEQRGITVNIVRTIMISIFDRVDLVSRVHLLEFVKAALNAELRRRQKRDEQFADANLLVFRDTQRQLAKAIEREREWALAIVYAGIERFPHKKIMAEAEAVLDELRKLQEEYARTHGGKATIETMEGFLKTMRRWWDANNSEQRAGALRMYVGPTIETANGIKEIWEIAQVAFDDLDDTVIKVLKEHADRIPNFLD